MKKCSKAPNSDMDGGWKDVLEDFTEDFFRFFLPEVHAGIDFAQGVKFLDKELSEIAGAGVNVKREADRLLEVRLKDGAAEWVLIHLEVQSSRDEGFAERMYVYNYRIFDKHRRRTASIAVLVDGDRGFRPARFRTELFGCATTFDFLVIKILDWDCDALKGDDNPFAVVVRVQLAKLKSERDVDKRYSFRMELTKELYQGRYGREQVVRLYRFIDYVLKLPKLKELELYEEERRMPYMTSNERIARQEGKKEGKKEGQLEAAKDAVLDVLEARFGQAAAGLREKIQGCNELLRLRNALRQAALIGSPGELEL